MLNFGNITRLSIAMNPINFWQIIKDDTKHTFEVIGRERNTNHFTNQTHAMQKAGMNVSHVILPVGSKAFAKDSIKFTGYSPEDGLYERLLKQYRDLTIGSIDPNDFLED